MKKIITIGREFGAGGGEIGRRVAKELGIPFYDKDLILQTAKMSSGLTPEEVRRWDERVPQDFGFAQSLFDFYSRPLSDRLWDAQMMAIRAMADKESCVIVGRNADYILREFDHCLRVFVHADLTWRMERMKAKMPENSDEKHRANILAADKARANSCARYTGARYGTASNYDLTICTSKLGVDKAVALVLAAAEGI